MILNFLNMIFHGLHLLVIIVNVFFVFIPPLRKIHFIIINITALSWASGGFFGSFGYCFLTDYHWHIKEKLGETTLPPDYISYLLINFMGIHLSYTVVQALIGSVFAICFSLAWYYKFKKKKT